MSLKRKFIFRIVFYILLLIFLCEYLIYYFLLVQCGWPQLNPKNEEPIISKEEADPVRVILLADTHLLGSRKGHWFDKLRREWQMYRAFQTAMTLHKPDLVFILGDVFDEGLWCSDEEFNYYVDRFHSLFHVSPPTEIFVVVGNHDIGFHYGISQYLKDRFARAFKAPSVRLVSVAGNHFILINSMAMEGDGCFLCRPAELQLNKIAARLQCTRGVGRCKQGMALKQYSRPILLQKYFLLCCNYFVAENNQFECIVYGEHLGIQHDWTVVGDFCVLPDIIWRAYLYEWTPWSHFPMYRESDAECNEPDEAPEDLKTQKFRERWECLSREASEMLMDELKPRVVVAGHTHHGCHREYKENNAHEYTIPSFSWRNKDNPSFMMAVFSPNNYAMSKCYMPRETTVIKLYSAGIILMLFGRTFVALFKKVADHFRRWKGKHDDKIL